MTRVIEDTHPAQHLRGHLHAQLLSGQASTWAKGQAIHERCNRIESLEPDT